MLTLTSGGWSGWPWPSTGRSIRNDGGALRSDVERSAPVGSAAVRTRISAMRTEEDCDVRAEVRLRTVQKLCKVGSKLATNTKGYGFMSGRIDWREVVESIARRGVSASLGQRRANRFPSVLLQPLGHLSVFRINDLRAATERVSHPSVPRGCSGDPHLTQQVRRAPTHRARELSRPPIVKCRRFSMSEPRTQRPSTRCVSSKSRNTLAPQAGAPVAA